MHVSSTIPRLPGYRIFDPIGHGGFGVVYDAIDLRSGYRVAVKKLHDAICRYPHIRRLFQQEANHYLYLDHENIARLTDFIIRNQKYYLVTEFIEGIQLKDYIARNKKPLSLPVACHIIHQILDAIEYAHKNKVLHLDIKPANIMVLPDNKIKILDFGISQVKGAQIEMMNITGSPRYMSPEQTNKQHLDERSDVYMIGLVFYEMLTGVPPFAEVKNHKEMFQKIRKGMITSPLAYNPALPDYALNTIRRATAVDQGERYASCREFKKALSKI